MVKKCKHANHRAKRRTEENSQQMRAASEWKPLDQGADSSKQGRSELPGFLLPPAGTAPGRRGDSPPWTGDSLEGKGPQALTLGDGPLVK